MIADVLDASRVGRAAWNDVRGEADGIDHVEHEARERTDEQTQTHERYCSEVQRV